MTTHVARRLAATALSLVLFARGVEAATFIVPPDRALVARADAIVVATALNSRAQFTPAGGIETVTTMLVSRRIKGLVADTFDVYEPGGAIGDVSMTVPGSPQFTPGEDLLLFLKKSGENRWSAADLIVGKFSFRRNTDDVNVLVRDEDELRGWDPDLKPHVERQRAADAFLRFVNETAAGRPANEDYFVAKRPLKDEPRRSAQINTVAATSTSTTSSPAAVAAPAVAPYTAASYTMIVSSTLGSRWTVFPSAVTWYTGTTQEPGAPGGGTTAVTTGIASWNNDCPSNVNYVYGGTDNGSHTQGLHAADGANTVLFERDLSAWGVSPFTCSSSGYSGTLGLGGVTNAQGTHTLGSETFYTTQEADVEMNQGLANCTLLFNNGDFNSAVTHELGHTLGFRHSDQNRAGSAACTTDASLECSSSAIMTAFVTTGLNAALQVWDQHAVQALYPGGTCGGAVPATPTGVNARATSATQVQVTWSAVSGATSYQIYRRGPGGSFTLVGTSSTTSFVDSSAASNTAYLYRVRAVDSSGSSSDSGSDLATTVMFTDDPLTAGVTLIRAVHLAELRTAVNAVRALAGLAPAAFTDAATPGVIVKAVHITELRARLDEAFSALGLPTGGWTDAVAPGVTVRAIHFQEIRNRVK